MSSYNRRSDRGKSRGTNSRGSTLFVTTCDECGKKCEVPFKPRGDRPVYCSDCFEKKEREKSKGSYNIYNKRGDRSRNKSNFGDREMYDAVCDKCGKNCKVPFKPSGDKPVYCSDCFEEIETGRGGARRDGKRDRTGGGNTELVKILNSINEKLDKILKVMDKPTVRKAVRKKAIVKNETKEKPITKKEIKKKPVKRKIIAQKKAKATIKKATKKTK